MIELLVFVTFVILAGVSGLAGIFIAVAAPEVPAFLRTYREISFVPSDWLFRISVSDAAPFTGISVQDDASFDCANSTTLCKLFLNNSFP